MALNNPQFLQKSVLATAITYKNSLLTAPISLTDGSGVDAMMDIDQSSDQIVMERTTTGDTSAYMQGVIVTGTITLHPQSPALAAINQVISVMETTTAIIPGTITVSGVGFNYTFNQVCFTTPAFIGYSMTKKIEDFQYSFSCVPPVGVSLAQVVESSAGLITL